MNYLIKFCNGIWSFAGKYLLWFVVFITPIHQFLITIYILLFIDLITGIYSKVFINKERLTSKRLKDTVLKFIGYSLAVYIGFQVDITWFADKSLVLAKIVAGYIMLTEFQSAIENLSIITGIDLWLMIKAKASAFFKTKIDAVDKTEKKDETN